jgi:hypothetical protein
VNRSPRGFKFMLQVLLTASSNAQSKRTRIELALFFACAVAHVSSSLAQPVSTQWRRDDATLISVCFDAIGKDAPASLRGTEITDSSNSSTTFELIGHTTTDRPMYQAKLVHPSRFRTVLIELPGGGTARFDRPDKLESSIEGWVYSQSPMQCVAGDRTTAARSILSGIPISELSCPELGTNLSFRVDNGPGYTSRRILERQRGLNVLNGLKGCRDLIYTQK